jgi:DNA-binding winged helix-turn-helix (wHTH) protein
LIDATPREFELLSYLISHPIRVLRHREILQAVWGPDSGDDVEALRVVVNELLKKIEIQPSKPVYLLTDPWAGYRLCRPSDDEHVGKKASAPSSRPCSADPSPARGGSIFKPGASLDTRPLIPANNPDGPLRSS